MKFVEKHFNKHHLLHAPHKWFLALLLSPVHAAEMHYQKQYHLQFAHARKLFLFDMCLLASIFVLAGSWIFISLYDPTVTKDVVLAIAASTDKIKNGEPITYTIEYQNKSKENLIDGSLAIDVPKGFIFLEANPAESFSPQHKTFVLGTLAPGATGKVSVKGIFFANADDKVLTVGHFSYKQQSRGVVENKIVKMFTTPRGSVLSTVVTAPDEIVNQSTTELQVAVTNNGERPLEHVSVVLNLPSGTVTTKEGTLSDKKVWNIDGVLKPKSTSVLNFDFTPMDVAEKSGAQFLVTPQIKMQENVFTLDAPIVHAWKVLTPNIRFTALFQDAPSSVVPGKTLITNVVIQNQGNISLSDGVITIPLSDEIDSKRLLELNRGTLDKNGFHISSKFVANLVEISPGAQVTVPLVIPLKNNFEGNDVVVSIHPTLSAKLKNVGGNFSQTTKTPDVKIGTKLMLDASARYYTAEGDQLGRGPLPPHVGKQTKYAAIIRINNTTSKVENISLSAELPPRVEWTGRTTASIGKEPTFDANTRMVKWNALSVEAGTSVSIFMELGLTPDSSQIGTTPLLLKNISVNGMDTFIDASVNARARDVDTSLPSDLIAKNKGVIIKE